MASTLIIQSLIALVGFLIYQQYFWKPKKNLPPGPKGLPLVGNILNLPPKDTPLHEHWNSINDKYGPIASVTILGQPMIFVTDKEAAQEILEKRSQISSGRPVFQFANYSGFGEFISFHQSDKRFSSQRKVMHKAIGTRALVSKYAKIQEREAGRLLLRTLRKPQNILQHFETEAGAVILKIVYGYTINPDGSDPLVGLIDRMMSNLFLAAVPFVRLIEFIPAVKWLPDGFPGTGFKTEAIHYSKEIQAVVDEPYKFVRKQMINQNIMDSYVSKLVQECIGDADEPSDADAYNIKWSAAALYGGGADTTVSTLTSFILAMTMFPEAQRKAQEEIDRVTGGARLPNLDDVSQMPFVEAMVSEALRWCPILPIGVAHTMSEDFNYKGYDLPKGAYVFPAVWSFTHDPFVYADPDVFAPERFLAPRNEPDPRWTIFGFGRRVCPGRFLADSSLFLNLAYIVAVFDVSKDTDEQGNVMEPKLALKAAGAVAKLKPFPFKITPRSEKHADLIRTIEREHPWEESDAPLLGELPPPSR